MEQLAACAFEFQTKSKAQEFSLGSFFDFAAANFLASYLHAKC
jgi:hypothetical protein